jgi:hypothetical protein
VRLEPKRRTKIEELCICLSAIQANIKTYRGSRHSSIQARQIRRHAHAIARGVVDGSAATAGIYLSALALRHRFGAILRRKTRLKMQYT